jgi:hypothetical protein
MQGAELAAARRGHDEGMHLHSGDGPGSEGPSEDDFALIRRMSPPENEIPAPVAISTLLARTDEVAIPLIAAQVFTNGVRFELAVRLRREPRGTMAQRSYALLNGFPVQDSDESLLLGLEFADGRTVMNVPHPGFRALPTAGGPDEPMLSMAGGGGGGRSFDQSFWLTPLPPAGPLLVVCAWTAVGIGETRTARTAPPSPMRGHAR